MRRIRKHGAQPTIPTLIVRRKQVQFVPKHPALTEHTLLWAIHLQQLHFLKDSTTMRVGRGGLWTGTRRHGALEAIVERG